MLTSVSTVYNCQGSTLQYQIVTLTFGMTTITHEESLDRALADVELLLSAYPDETQAIHDGGDDSGADASFPLRVQLGLSDTALITLEWVQGYPVQTSVQVYSYRSSPSEKSQMESAVSAVRTAASEALEDHVEAGFVCAAAARETWEAEARLQEDFKKADERKQAIQQATLDVPSQQHKVYEWKTGEPLTDRKSAFQAHVCRIGCESDVKPALSRLLDGNSKLHRATHNMVSTCILYRDAKGLLHSTGSSTFSKSRISGHTESERRRMAPLVF